MGSALYAVVSGGAPAAHSEHMDGSALAGALDALDSVAEELGLPKLLDFFSMDPEEAASLMEGGSPDDLPALQWFQPSKALPTVRALLKHVQEHPDEVQSAKRVLTDLTALEKILVGAQKGRAKFHLALDY